MSAGGAWPASRTSGSSMVLTRSHGRALAAPERPGARYGAFSQQASALSTTAPGPAPVAVSMPPLPVAGAQKVATITSSGATLGKSPVAPVTVTGGTGRPVRLIPGSPGRVGKHGTEVSLLQQPWLSPPLTLHPRDHARLVPGVVVEREHLGGVFAWIAAQQHDRDAARLANPKVTHRTKKRLRAAASSSASSADP